MGWRLPSYHDLFSWNANYPIHNLDHFVQLLQDNTRNKNAATVALVTLYSGFSAETATETDNQVFFCSRKNLMDYAAMHGYFFFSEQNFSLSVAPLPLLPHMTQGLPINTGRYQKLRFLLQLLEEHPFIEWFLWVDADAVVTDTNATVQEKIHFFQDVHTNDLAARKSSKEKDQKHDDPPLSMVIAENWSGINNGVFLIRNNWLGRRILMISYMTYVHPKNTWADQKAMILGIFNKETNSSFLRRSILSVPRQNAHWLQNFRGCGGKCLQADDCVEYWTAEKNPWFLHMPNTDPAVRKEHLEAIGVCNTK